MSDAVAEAIAACAVRLGDDATGVLARLGGRLGESARELARGLTQQPATERKIRRAEYLAAARAVVPAGIRSIDPTWIETALSSLPARARTAVANNGGEPIDVWFARWAMAGLPPMPAPPWHGELERWLARPEHELVGWLANIGADQLAYALGDQLSTTREPFAAARARIAIAPRLGNLGSKRAALQRCHGITSDDGLGVVVIGCRALAPHLANDPLARMQLTRRFPYVRGTQLAAELVAFSTTPLDHAPTLPALLSP